LCKRIAREIYYLWKDLANQPWEIVIGAFSEASGVRTLTSYFLETKQDGAVG
jgi:hypothetical protein